MKLKQKSLFLALALLSMATHAQSTTGCSELLARAAADELDPSQEIKSWNEQTPFLQKLLSPKRLRDFSDKLPPSYEELIDKVMSCYGTRCQRLQIDTDDFSATLLLSYPGDELALDVLAFGARNEGALVMKAEGLASRSEPLAHSLYLAIHGIKQSHPELKAVRLRGLMVRNPRMADLLERLGFKHPEIEAPPEESTSWLGKLVHQLRSWVKQHTAKELRLEFEP